MRRQRMGMRRPPDTKSHLKGQVIIALTASTFEEERKAIVLSAGCDDFVRKLREEVIQKDGSTFKVLYLCA